MSEFPLPGMGHMSVAVRAPGTGRGWWAGSSSSALDRDGTFLVAYRVRTGERTGLARLTGRRPGELEQTSDKAVADVRYLDVLPLPGVGYRIWYEARLPDESHELCTELIEP